MAERRTPLPAAERLRSVLTRNLRPAVHARERRGQLRAAGRARQAAVQRSERTARVTGREPGTRLHGVVARPRRIESLGFAEQRGRGGWMATIELEHGAQAERLRTNVGIL